MASDLQLLLFIYLAKNRTCRVSVSKPALVAQLRSILLQHNWMRTICVSSLYYKNTKNPRLKAAHVAKEKFKWDRKRKDSKGVQKETQYSSGWLSKKPVDDVWIRAFYPPQSFSFKECVKRHQEYADPNMLNNLDGFVYADMELNLSTKKKTKFMRPVSSTILLPHCFDDGNEKRCAVFCKSTEDQTKARDLGALFVGGEDLIKQFEKEQITKDDYDFILCTPDILVDMLSIRTVLRDRFPSKEKGNINANIEEMVNLYSEGVSYQSSKTDVPGVGKLQLPIGSMTMTPEELHENFLTYVSSVTRHKPKEQGNFITKVILIAPPSTERFLVDTSEYQLQPLDKKSAPKSQETEVKDEEDSDDEEEEKSRSS